MPDAAAAQETFATDARLVLGRAMDGDALLALAKAGRAFDPAVFDDHPPLFVPCEISSDRVDSYFTKMDESTTLPNFAADAAAGVGVQDSHNTRALGFGRSLTGEVVTADGVTTVRSDFYTIPGLGESDRYILGIKAGIYRDVSVGFHFRSDGLIACSLCGGDLMDWWGDCIHVPGVTYEVKNEKGAVTERALCIGTVVNGGLSEYSMVYDGATPGASVRKAQHEVEAGRLRPELARMLEETAGFRRHGVRLTGAHHVWPGATAAGRDHGGSEMPGTTPARRDNEPAATPQAEPLAAAEPAVIPDETTVAEPAEPIADATVVDGEGDDAEPVAAETPAAGDDPLAEDRARPDLIEAGIAVGRDPVRAFRAVADAYVRIKPLADLGRTYRNDLLAECDAEGVRAGVERTARERTVRLLRRSDTPIPDIKAQRDEWRDAGNRRFPGGRETTEGDETGAETTPNGRATEPANLYG